MNIGGYRRSQQAVTWEPTILKALVTAKDTSWSSESVRHRCSLRQLEPSGSCVTSSGALQALPPHHADPFDRMLIAQAQHEGFTLVSVDSRFSDYDVEPLRWG